MPDKIYRINLSFSEAKELWLRALRDKVLNHLCPLTEEKIETIHSKGRITSRPVRAKISSPFFHASAVDGYALRFTDTVTASERTPVYLQINKDCLRVDTGDPLQPDMNAVVMLEDVNTVKKDGAEFIELREALTPWQNVRIAGEDIVQGELIIPENERITAFYIGAMLASQNTEVWVRKKPVVSIIPTGSEIVEPGSEVKPGDIIEFNSRFLSALVEDTGSEYRRYAIVPDNKEILKRSILEALSESHVLLVIGGSSLGREDLLADAIREIGDIVVHGVNIKPGKPLMLSIVQNKPVIGIPGYPVSAYIAFELFVKPLLYMLQSLEEPEAREIEAILSRNIASTLGIEEFIRVKIGSVSGKYIATPLARGAGLMSSLVKADGILQIPSNIEGIEAGSKVKVKLLRDERELLNTIVFIGSHDNTIDLIHNFLKKHYPSLSLSSANVGSMGGLIALRRRECHITGIHLLDEATGEYNIPFVKRILQGESFVVVNLVYRQQGLIVKRGNPKAIKSFHDLIREDIFFVNRQRGSGTRLLLDKHLKELGIDPQRIKGYEIEDYTHMSVASKVLTGVADVALGIYSAAKALDLDFIPVAEERYDLVILEESLRLPMIEALLEIIKNDSEFKDAVHAMGGYDTRDTGKVIMQTLPLKGLSGSVAL
ncbi:MAG: molybdopterin biosynthesis protein [Thermodesulfovibrionales bacterium]|nr:molybdopterin biosynthesis protein [Thermodesulfovibrionales bacterium]